MTDDVFVEISTEDTDLVVTDDDPPVSVVVEDAPVTFDVVVDALPYVQISAENVDIVVPEDIPPVDVVIEEDTTPIIVEGSVGPRGPQGPSGSMTFEGTAWWTGEGPPGTIVGSKPGDEYIDTLTGNVYKLEVH